MPGPDEPAAPIAPNPGPDEAPEPERAPQPGPEPERTPETQPAERLRPTRRRSCAGDRAPATTRRDHVPAITRATSPAWCWWSRWPACSTSTNSAPGIWPASRRAAAIGTTLSTVPANTVVGAEI